MTKPAWVIIALAAGCASHPVGAGESHCASQEAIVFSCNTGNKIASVCASKDLADRTGYLQYRFGPKAAPELVYPETTAPPSRVHARTLTFAGGGGAYLRFERGRYDYVVYTALIRGTGATAGVVVEKDHRLVADLRCKGGVSSELGPDFFDKAGLPPDPNDFEPP
jgi:hypothetical protein